MRSNVGSWETLSVRFGSLAEVGEPRKRSSHLESGAAVRMAELAEEHSPNSDSLLLLHSQPSHWLAETIFSGVAIA